MSVRLFRFLFCVLAAFCAESAIAQKPKPAADTINTDRPDQTESPHIVPAGELQVEGGFTVSPFDSSGGKTPLIGIVVIRYGISKKLELRLMAEDGRDRDRFVEETTQGLFPLAIGGKLLLLKRERGVIPQIALLAWLKLPITNRSSEQSGYWSPQVLAAFENKIGDKLDIEYNAGAKQEVYGYKWHGVASVSLHVELTEKLRVFGEYFGQYGGGEDPMHNVDAGFMYLLTPAFQLDIAAGRSFSAPYEQSSSFASVGLSFLVR